jgi:hypothetical protein
LYCQIPKTSAPPFNQIQMFMEADWDWALFAWNYGGPAITHSYCDVS